MNFLNMMFHYQIIIKISLSNAFKLIMIKELHPNSSLIINGRKHNLMFKGLISKLDHLNLFL